MAVVAPAIIIVFFSFIFGNVANYRIGIIDIDKSYISSEIIETINNIDNVDIIDVTKENYEILLLSHQIQMIIIIEDGFSDKILNLEEGTIRYKSISNSDFKETILSIVKSKVDNLGLIAKVSKNNMDVFKENSEKYKGNFINYNLNDMQDVKPSIDNSLGIIIMMILISSSSISNFLIQDYEQGTMERVLVSGIKPKKYYIALISVFFLLSSISTFIYYTLCKLLRIDFGLANTKYFLVIMLLLNLVAIALNLFIASFTRNRYISNTINILIVIPTCMISGVFWDFKVMPEYIQRIGNFLPQRWVYIAIENLKISCELEAIYGYIFYMIGIALILFCLSLSMFRKMRYS